MAIVVITVRNASQIRMLKHDLITRKVLSQGTQETPSNMSRMLPYRIWHAETVACREVAAAMCCFNHVLQEDLHRKQRAQEQEAYIYILPLCTDMYSSVCLPSLMLS